MSTSIAIQRNNVTGDDLTPELPSIPRLLPEDMPDEVLAQFIGKAFIKMRAILPYVDELKTRFKKAREENRKIAGCSTWTEFCEVVLQRTDSAIRMALKRERDQESEEPESIGPAPTTEVLEMVAIQERLAHELKTLFSRPDVEVSRKPQCDSFVLVLRDVTADEIRAISSLFRNVSVAA